jgi:hypothetical protein
MNILICGSRNVKINIEDIDEVFKVLTNTVNGFSVNQIISGGARGPDSVAIAWAKYHYEPYKVYPANWTTYGKSAGIIRNKKMVDECDVCIAFWDGKSRGTEFTLDYAKKLDKKTYVVDCANDRVGDVWKYPKDGYKTEW